MNNIDEKFIQILGSIKLPKNFDSEITLGDEILFKIALRKWLEKHPEKSVGEVLLLLEKHGFVKLNSLTLQGNENQEERLERKKENSISNVPTMLQNYDLYFAVKKRLERKKKNSIPNVPTMHENYDLGFAVMDIKETMAAEEAKLKYWKRYGRK